MKKKNKIVSAVMAVVITLSGCGNQGSMETTSENGMTMEATKEAGSVEATSNQVAMGRYVDAIQLVSEDMYTPCDFVTLDNGDLVVLDSVAGKYVSKDQGVTWQKDRMPVLEDIFTKNYVMTLAMAKDGMMVIQHDEYNEETDASETEEEYILHPVYSMIDPDGNRSNFQIEATEDELYVRRFAFDDAGNLYAIMLGDDIIYEIDPDTGGKTKYLSLEDRPYCMEIRGNRMLIIGRFGLLCYDMEKKSYEDCTVLTDFLQEQYGMFDEYDIGYNYVVWMDDKDNVYVGGKQGLHRYHFGGTTMEQIINGKLSTLGDPSHALVGLTEITEQVYAALFSDGKFVTFQYDETMPTVPSEQLTVYSLEENGTIEQAISIYQTQNPDVYVEYVTGVGEDYAVTRDDALKKLNTQLMAGEGPDVLVLDQMPMDSYMEKGVLQDLSSFYTTLGQEEKIFDNLIHPFYEGEALYMLPCEYSLPILLGEKEAVDNARGIAGLADTYVKIGSEKPDDLLLYAYTEKAIMKKLAPICAPSWKNSDGSLRKEQLIEFLESTKKINDVQKQNPKIEAKGQRLLAQMEEIDMTYEDSVYLQYIDAFSYLCGMTSLSCGLMGNTYEYMEFSSISKKEGLENTDFQLAKGQSEDVFVPQTIVGIHAGSSHKEEAENFLRLLLGTEVQEMLYNGFPVNETAIEHLFIPNEEYLGPDNTYSSMCSSDEEGNMVDLDVYFPDEPQIGQFMEWIRSARVPYLPDTLLEKTVYEEGIRYFHGEQTVEQAVKAIMEKVEIYGAE